MPRLPLSVRLIAEITADPNVEVFHTPDRRAQISMRVGGRRDTFAVASHEVEVLVNRMLITASKAPSQSTVNSVIAGLEVAALDGPCRRVFLRTADLGDTVAIDLADPAGNVVVCTPSGYKVTKDSPVAFVRPPSMQALPVPVAMPDVLDEFRRLCGETSDDGFVLMIGAMIVALRGRAPFPVLALRGAKGSGKSTTAELLRGLVDPNEGLIRSFSGSERDLAIAADNSWLLAFDNLSEITPEMSDCLCRFTSGGAFATRRLYRNRDEELFVIARPVIITSILDVVTTSDLGDRTLPVTFDPVTRRIAKADLTRRYDAIKAGVLAELLLCLSASLNATHTGEAELPRLADAALTADAGLEALGFGRHAFTEALNQSRTAHTRAGRC